MATQTRTRPPRPGVCTFCKSEVDKSKMTQHLKGCKERKAANAVGLAVETAYKQRLFQLLVEGRYLPEYWMQLEIPAAQPLDTLDVFLRRIWLECCGHLSAFRINGTSYRDDPEDMMDFQVVTGTVQASPEELFEEEPDEDAEQGVEDLTEEQFAEAMQKWLDEYVITTEAKLPDELVTDLKKKRTNREMVVFLKERLKTLPDPMQDLMVAMQGGQSREEVHLAYMHNLLQKRLLEEMLEAIEDCSLNVRLKELLSVGQKFSYEYDFGSTTELNFKVLAEREGVAQGDGEVFVLARNLPPDIFCQVCNKPATQFESGYYFDIEEHAYCDTCAQKADPDMLLPVVNSPRAGVCAYTG